MNLYAFVENDGVNQWDTLGLTVGGNDIRNIVNPFAALFAAITGDTLAADMIMHYGNATGSDYVLSHKQAKKLKTILLFNVFAFPGVASLIDKAVKEKRTQNVPEVSAQFSVSGRYGNNGLGNFAVPIKGKIKCKNPPLLWEFDGSLKITDRFDFDLRNMSGRSELGKFKTVVGLIALAGKPFNVRSEEHAAKQDNTQYELQW